MAEYKPILAGTAHAGEKEEIANTHELIVKNKGKAKTFGLEGISYYAAQAINVFPEKIARAYLEDMKIADPYWIEIAFFAKKHGYEIIPLDITAANASAEKLIREYRQKKKPSRREKNTFYKKTMLRVLTLTENSMIERIRKFKPDLILVGGGHTVPIVKSFGIKNIHFVSREGLKDALAVSREMRRLYNRIKLAKKLRAKVKRKAESLKNRLKPRKRR